MQPRAHWWRSFCSRTRSRLRGAMRRSYSLRGARAVIFTSAPRRAHRFGHGTLERFREQPPGALAQGSGESQRQPLPHARREVEGVLLALERGNASRPAEHVLVVEGDRLGPPLLLEMERSRVPLAPPHVERSRAACDSPLDRLPIEHLVRAQRKVTPQRRRPRVPLALAQAREEHGARRKAFVLDQQDLRPLAQGLRGRPEVVGAAHRSAEVAQVLEQDAVQAGVEVAPPTHREPRLLALPDLVPELGIESLPLLLGARREREDQRGVLVAGLEPGPAMELIPELQIIEP